MVNIGWIVVSVGTVALVAVVGIIVFQQMLRGKRTGFPLQEERTFSRELVTLGSSLVILGIVFGMDRLISYSFMGAGVLLAIIGAIKSRRKREKSSMEMR